MVDLDEIRITASGRNAIDKMKRAIDGDLLSNVETLAREGKVLSDPTVWQGKAASRFRSEWPEIEQKLRKMRQELLELQNRIHDTHIRIGGEDR